MRLMQANVMNAAKLFVERVNERFPVKQVLLFGSHARGHAREQSDIDLAVLLNEQQGDFFSHKWLMDDIAFDVLLETGQRIQPLPVWLYDWQHPEDYSNPYLLNNIRQEGVAL